MKKDYLNLFIVGRNGDECGRVSCGCVDSRDERNYRQIPKAIETESVSVTAHKVFTKFLRGCIQDENAPKFIRAYIIGCVCFNFKKYFKLLEQGEFTSDNFFSDIRNGVNFSDELKNAIMESISTYEEARKAGFVIDFNPVNEFDRLMVKVPEGMEVKHGDVMTFINGKTKDGVTVPWNAFTRSNVVISCINDKYYVDLKSTKTIAKTSKLLISKLWAACPPTTSKCKNMEDYRSCAV